MINDVLIDRLKSGRSLEGKDHLQLSPKGLHFKPGQIFKGKVLQVNPEGFTLVATEGKTFKARTSVRLAPGKSYSFIVKTVGPRIELGILREDDYARLSAGKLWASGHKERLRFVSILRDLVASHSLGQAGETFREALEGLRNLLPILMYEGPAQKDTLWLFRNLIASGIFWENKVFRYLFADRSNEPVTTITAEDLKGLLLSLKEGMEDRVSDSGDMEKAMDRIDRLLSLLKNEQALNLAAMREGWGWYWFIAGADEREFLHGEVVGKKEEAGDVHRLHMNLSFTRIGEIYVDCVLRQDTVSVSMQVTDNNVGRFLKENIPALEKGLEDRGLTIARLACEVVPERTPFSIFSGEKSPYSSLMDMVI